MNKNKNPPSTPRKLSNTEKEFISLNKQKKRLHIKLEHILCAINQLNERILAEKRELQAFEDTILEKKTVFFKKMITLLHEIIEDPQTSKHDVSILKKFLSLWHNEIWDIVQESLPKSNVELENHYDFSFQSQQNQQELNYSFSQTLFCSIASSALIHIEIRRNKDDFTSIGFLEEKQEIRKLYIQLAYHFHPDRAWNEQLLRKNEEIMKKLNQAYREGNFQLLLLLEKELPHNSIINKKALLESNIQINEEKIKTLITQIELLKKQIKKANQQKKALEKSPDARLIKQIDKNIKNGLPKFSYIINDLQEDLNYLKYLVAILEKYKQTRDSRLIWILLHITT
ncbi:MAG: J domain-containing protein [Bacteroidia bacterium]|nr:J domain-containing protein [Bacteroidia bacterium]MDW8159569.1 J domain-containing protein [Bacteroidia bacterium]